MFRNGMNSEKSTKMLTVEEVVLFDGQTHFTLVVRKRNVDANENDGYSARKCTFFAEMIIRAKTRKFISVTRLKQV